MTARHKHSDVVVRTVHFSDLIVRVFMCTVCHRRRAESELT